MQTVKVPYRQTGYFSSLILDYLDNKESLKPFYRYACAPEAFDQAIADRENTFPVSAREILATELEGQYKGLDISGAVAENIRALRQPDTYCIVTAHQLNIFSGPLYVLIKIANTINICRQLAQRYPQHRFVPVYMLGSEDHDFDEIATTRIFQQEFVWDNVQNGPMGRYATEGLLHMVEQVRNTLGDMPYAAEWCTILSAAYRQPDLAAATRHLIHGIFGNEGLVCVDGDAAALKQQFVPIMQRELEEGFSLPHLQNTSALLEQAGYHSQLSGRPINLFYAKGNTRERIVQEDSGYYAILNTDLSLSKEDILQQLKLHPEYFSPNAVLRPAYQQTILPSLAYVGGGGELAYWMQLKAVFEAAGVFYPMLVLRNSILILNKALQQRMEKLSIQQEAVFSDTETLKKAYLEGQEAIEPAFEVIYSGLEKIIEQLKELAAEADPTLEGWAGAEGQKIKGIAGGIEKRVIKTYKARHEQALTQIDKLKEQLFPGGNLQERVQNGGQWYAQHGHAFIRQLLSLDPFQKQFTLLQD